MSGKFMHVKKIFISTLTALIIASQLTGCAAASESELLSMINNQQTICIEVAVPKEAEKGEEITYEWTELASLDNYETFRLNFDDILNITAFGNGGKNGVVYVDLEGNHTNNSTFYYAMMNKKFRTQLEDTDTNEKLVDIAYENYADISSDAEAKLAYINAYFNILEDAEPNYYNGNSSVTRAEFLSAIYRSQSPVQELEFDDEFVYAVDPIGENEHTIFAQQMLEKSYLNLSEKSLNQQTFSGDITRAEAIYTLVKTFYADKYDSVTGKETAFSDTKNGGDIASKQKFIETKKNPETKEKYTEYKNYWMSYELQYAINNPDKGMPESLYKAMVVAKQVGLVTGEESRWDEAITKNEVLNFIVKIYGDMDTITNADRGSAVGEQGESSSINKVSTELGGSTSIENITEEAHPLSNGVVKNEDGTYSYSMEFLNTIKSYDFFEGASDEEVKATLDFFGDDLINETPEQIHNMFNDLSQSGSKAADIFGRLDTPDKPVEVTNKDTGSTNTQSQNNNVTGNEQQNNTPVDNGNQAQGPVGTMDSFFGQDYGFGGDGTNIDDVDIVIH